MKSGRYLHAQQRRRAKRQVKFLSVRLLCRNWLKGRAGDRCNALLAAAGFNLRKLLQFLRSIPYLRDFFCALLITLHPPITAA